jgi:hypothetical protein
MFSLFFNIHLTLLRHAVEQLFKPYIETVAPTSMKGHCRVRGIIVRSRDWHGRCGERLTSMRGETMGEKDLPRVKLRTSDKPPGGMNSYEAIPEMVEFRRAGPPPARVRTLALGRLALSLEEESGELVGLRSYVKTGRWKTGEAEPPPEPDAEGILEIDYPRGAGGFSYLPSQPLYLWHEESASLRISLDEGAALVFKVADCLMAGVDRKGRLTDVWMLGLELAAP